MSGFLLVSMAVASLSALTPADTGPVFDPPVAIEEILAAWQAGDASEAGLLAASYLEYSVEYDGHLASEGAALAFIAAIGSLMRGGGAVEASYWMWVARQHEDACGALAGAHNDVVNRTAARPGSGRETDRRIRISAFLPAARRPCRAGSHRLDVPAAPQAPWTEHAVAVFGNSPVRPVDMPNATRIGSQVRIPLLYEYPANSISPALTRGRELVTVLRHTSSLPSTIVVFSPCAPQIFSSGNRTIELCRADQPQPASE